MELDIAVIGAGMAGLTAGLYAARGGKQVAVIEQFMPGGQVATISRLENYPGFPGGVDGAALMQSTAEQAESFGCQLLYESVLSLTPGEPIVIQTDQGEHTARAAIIAGGSVPARLGLADEERLIGRGVSYCATCDGALFRNKVVAVVGGGDTALTDALVLAGFASQVYLIHRRQEYRAAALLQQRLAENTTITPLLGKRVSMLLGEKKLSALVLEDVAGGAEQELAVDGLFVAVGIRPVTDFVRGIVALDDGGRIITDRHLSTNIPGLFAAGDCRDTPLRQVVTAAADGAVAAMSAIEYITAAR